MKKIIYLAWNDIKVEFSDRSALLFFFILPLIFTAVLGVSFGGNGDPDADNRWLIPVVDLDQSDLSKQLVSELEYSTVVRPELYTRSDADQLLSEGEAITILVIGPNFSNDLQEGKLVRLELVKSPNDPNVLAIEQVVNTAVGKIDGSITAAVSAVNAANNIQPFTDDAERNIYFLDSLEMAGSAIADPVAQVVITQTGQAPNTYFTSFELSSAGQLVTWTLITLLGASEVFVNERIGGTLRRLLSTPSTKTTIITGKITGRFSMGLLQMIVLISVGSLVFNVNWGNSPVALAMVVVSFGLAAVALGVMLGAFARTRAQASNLTVMFSMLMAALGGAWWQLEITPPIYQKIVKLFPSTWAMKGFNEVIVKGSGPEEVLGITLVLLSFALVFFIIGIYRLQFE